MPRTVKVTKDISFQVIIEGIWGNPRASGYIAVDDVTFYDGECEAVPATANVVKGVCSFDRDSCGWRNTSTAETFDWRMATLTKRPANLPDKTYGAPVGYAYFDSTADSEADEEREPSVSFNCPRFRWRIIVLLTPALLCHKDTAQSTKCPPSGALP